MIFPVIGQECQVKTSSVESLKSIVKDVFVISDGVRGRGVEGEN